MRCKGCGKEVDSEDAVTDLEKSRCGFIGVMQVQCEIADLDKSISS